MAKISEIMLLQQPEQPALAIEVKTDMKGMSQAIGENFVRIDSLFKKQGEVTTDIPFVEYPDFESLTEDRIEMIIGLNLRNLYRVTKKYSLSSSPPEE